MLRARRALSQVGRGRETPLGGSGRTITRGSIEGGTSEFLKKAAKATATPALEVLDQSTRAGEFVTGAFNQQAKSVKKGDIAGAFNPVKNIKAGVESGVTRKKRVHGDDLLKTVGVKNKTARTVGGLALDIGLDPVTYATFGAGAGAKGAAQVAAKAGTKAEAEALAKGASRKAARKAKSQASRRAYAKAPKNKGISVGGFGRQTSGKTTAAISEQGSPQAAHPGTREGVQARPGSPPGPDRGGGVGAEGG